MHNKLCYVEILQKYDGYNPAKSSKVGNEKKNIHWHSNSYLKEEAQAVIFKHSNNWENSIIIKI